MKTIINLIEKNAVASIQLTDNEGKVIKEHKVEIASLAESFTNGNKDPMTLAAYGLKQKLSDAFSSFTLKECNGDKVRHAEGRYAMAVDMAECLAEGKWTRARAGGGRTAKADPYLIQALAEVKGVSVPVATALIEKITADQCKELAAHEEIAKAMAKARDAAREEAESIDLSDLF